ncbi:MAG: DUF460 domain-containing protein [Nanoarchaeota archaeon]
MQPLIIGIDPGTTTAYAALTLNGEVVNVESSKRFDLRTLLETVAKHGQPIVVGCDKALVPSFVKRFATKFGARVVRPKQDLTVRDKKAVVGKKPIRNDHECDALAAAILSYRKYVSLFEKVDAYLQHQGKPQYTEALKILLIKQDTLSVANGLRKLLQKPLSKLNNNDSRPLPPASSPTTHVRELQKPIVQLEEQNQQLQEEMSQLWRTKETLERSKRTPPNQLLKEKEHTLHMLGMKMLDKESMLESQRKHIQTQNRFLAGLAGRTLLKKLDNLSDGEWQRKGFLNIQKEDVLLVADPNLVSENVVQKVQGSVVVYKHKLSVRKDLVYVSADKLKLDEIEHFASVSNEQLQKALAGQNVLKNVVDAYQKERQMTL